MIEPTVEITKSERRRFEVALGELVRTSAIDLTIVVRKVAFDLLRDIIRATPVDTGRARAAWTVVFEVVGLPTPRIGGNPTGIALGKADGEARVNLPHAAQHSRRLGGSEIGDKPYVEVINAVKYILPLEFGWSSQAPLGMVRKEVRRHARDFLTQLRRKGGAA